MEVHPPGPEADLLYVLSTATAQVSLAGSSMYEHQKTEYILR